MNTSVIASPSSQLFALFVDRELTAQTADYLYDSICRLEQYARITEDALRKDVQLSNICEAELKTAVTIAAEFASHIIACSLSKVPEDTSEIFRKLAFLQWIPWELAEHIQNTIHVCEQSEDKEQTSYIKALHGQMQNAPHSFLEFLRRMQSAAG